MMARRSDINKFALDVVKRVCCVLLSSRVVPTRSHVQACTSVK